jgi:energy-coupling factor transporter transmembrane protein EcfT
MLRKITPFFILSFLSIIWAIFFLITEKNLGWGYFAVFGLILIGIVLFVIDFGLKKWVKNHKQIVITQLTITLIFVFIYKYQQRTITLIIPSDFDKEYVTIIYGVEDTEALSISPITWNKKIEIPKSGIFLTSSDFSETLPETEIKMDSGIYLNSRETEKGFIRLTESEFELKGLNYKFRTWKIQDGFCCAYSMDEIEKYRTELKSQFEKIKASRQHRL